MASDGAIWFTDPTYGISDPREGYPAEPALPHQSVYRWHDDTGLARMIDLDQPNGLAFSRDERTLYVAESNATALPRVVACSWDGETLGAAHLRDGGCRHPRRIRRNSRDWLWISSEAGVVIVDDHGQRLGLIPTPHVVSNCTFDAETRSACSSRATAICGWWNSRERCGVMARIPAGQRAARATSGAPNVREIEVASFEIGVYPVTEGTARRNCSASPLGIRVVRPPSSAGCGPSASATP